ncbi:MAG: phosphatidylglycerophosphatase A [Betaproteobacteria bacterium]
MWGHPAHIVALGAGAGLAPVAPGTVGTLLAFPLYWLLAASSNSLVALAILGAAFLLGIWACGATGRALGAADHGAMVWDETVAFALVLVFTPAGWPWQIGAFLLFRFFDIVKPPPIRYFDRRLKSGFGVMFDDVLAAGYSLLVLAVCQRLLEPGAA